MGDLFFSSLYFDIWVKRNADCDQLNCVDPRTESNCINALRETYMRLYLKPRISFCILDEEGENEKNSSKEK